MNPGIGSALSAIGRIQGRIGEIQTRIGQLGPAAGGFEREMSRAGGRVGSAVSAPPGGAPGGAAPSGALGPHGAAPASELPSKLSAGGLFQTSRPLGDTSPSLGGGTSAYTDLIADAAARHDVDASLVRAVMAAESGGNPDARSPVGAIGLMQLMPGTARDLGVADATDPAQNIEGGTKYLAELTKKFGLEHGVAAYNAGPGAVSKYGGVPPYRETRAYVDRVMKLYQSFGERP